MKHYASVVTAIGTVIGDLVGSRTATDRRSLHDALTRSLAGVEAMLNAESVRSAPLVISSGDEFQGGFTTLGAALHAALIARAGLRAVSPGADLRCGVSWGATEVLDGRTHLQDGPGWWQARAAIDQAQELAASPTTRTTRTICRLPESDRAMECAINAALATRDQLMARLDPRSDRILHGVLSGRAKTEIAEAEGVSASAVSQRAHRDGLDAILRSAQLLREL